MLEILIMIQLGAQLSLLEGLRGKAIMAGIIECLMKELISFCLTYLINCQSMLIWVLYKEISMKTPSNTIIGKWWAAKDSTPGVNWNKISFKFWKMDLLVLVVREKVSKELKILRNLKVKNKWLEIGLRLRWHLIW